MTLELVNAVKAHAIANYNKGGWDYVVECWSDEEIAEDIAGCKTAAEAIKVIGEIVKHSADLRAEIQATAW